jgi:hypothetical protein
MRSTAIVPVFLIIGSLALADGASMIDLDRPGALEQLKQAHPQRYQQIRAVLRASERPACDSNEIALLQTRLNVRDLECGMIVFTRYPALRRVSFELDGTRYASTVVLEDASTLQPISTELPAAAH